MSAYLLTLCALQFSFNTAPVNRLLELYAEHFQCTPILQPALGTATPSHTDRILEFFPFESEVWPLINHDDPNLLANTRVWWQRGINPGVVVPAQATDLITSPRLLHNLFKAKEAGGVIVLPVERPLKRNLFSYSAFLSGIGLAPRIAYISEGYDQDVESLPAGNYLVAGHWKGQPDHPLPARWLKNGSSKFLPVYPASKSAIGQRAEFNMLAAGTTFTPEFVFNWQYANFEYTTSNETITSSLLGSFFLTATAFSVVIGTLAHQPFPDLLSSAGSILAWAAIFACLYIFVMFRQGFYRRLFRGKR